MMWDIMLKDLDESYESSWWMLPAAGGGTIGGA